MYMDEYNDAVCRKIELILSTHTNPASISDSWYTFQWWVNKEMCTAIAAHWVLIESIFEIQ